MFFAKYILNFLALTQQMPMQMDPVPPLSMKAVPVSAYMKKSKLLQITNSNSLFHERIESLYFELFAY
jgi:hypothetical protein